MDFFVTLEYSFIADLIADSVWMYPLLLSVHVFGMSLFVGLFLIRDLATLGWIRSFSPKAILPLRKYAWFGFGTNALSGAFLFLTQASAFVTSVPFLLKIALIVVAAVSASAVHTLLLAQPGKHRTLSVISMRLIATCSLLSMLGAIVAGRLIAYLSV